MRRVMPGLLVVFILHLAFPIAINSQSGQLVGFLRVAHWKSLEQRDQAAYVAGAADALSLISGHLGNAQKTQILRTYARCMGKLGRGVKIETITSLTKEMIESAPSKFQIPRATMDQTMVAGWVELAVADSCR